MYSAGMRNVLVAVTAALFLAALPGAYAQGSSKPKLDITVESSLSFDATMDALKMSAGAEKYGFQGSHDVSGTLAKKGFPRERLVVMEFCNPKMASVALKEDVMAGLMIPCPIMVWQKGSKVMVTAMDASLMGSMFRGRGMAAVGNTVAKDMRRILSTVAK
jgi:uncharacterized protein (DUF302 family)